MSNYRAWNAFIGELNRRPEFDGIREQLLEAGRKVILDGAPSPISAPQTAEQPSGIPEGPTDAPEAPEAVCDCGHDGLPPTFHFDCPIKRAELRRREAARIAQQHQGDA